MDAPGRMGTELVEPSAEMVRIVAEIWSSILGLAVEPKDESISLNGMSSFSACIQLTGDWKGAVTIQCSSRLARRITETMFDMAESDVGSSEVCDALGEIANMVGGNFKSVLQVPCQISLPSVAEGTNYTLVVAHARVVSRTAFTCEAEPMQVVVHRYSRSESRSMRGIRE